ncbi:hypothetical protein Lser_V15G17216 [Lactuca serriola]
MVTQLSPRAAESYQNSPSSSQTLFPDRTCCFCLPYRWRKVPSSEEEDDYNKSNGTLWSRGIAALMKVREWSEIVAGPRWKTFIRRFNHNKSFGKQSSKFQYDPFSYALNFDQGPLQNGDPEAENEYMIRNFSSRYVLPPPSTIPVIGKTPVDMGLWWFAPLGHQQTLVEGFFLALNRCRFLGWIDPPMCARFMLIIPRLLRNINNANYQVAKLKMCLFASCLLFVVAWVFFI